VTAGEGVAEARQEVVQPDQHLATAAAVDLVDSHHIVGDLLAAQLEGIDLR